MRETTNDGRLREGSAKEPSHAASLAAEFDAFYTRWLPRTYGYAAAHLGDTPRAEAVTRAVLTAALRAGVASSEAAIGRQLFTLLRRELARELRREPVRASSQDPRTLRRA